MRICLVYDCLFPYTVGGAERWYRNLAQRLAADGHEVTYLTLRQWPRGERGEVPGRARASPPARGWRSTAAPGSAGSLPPLVFGAGVLCAPAAPRPPLRRRAHRVVPVLLAARRRRSRGRSHRFRLVVDWFELWSARLLARVPRRRRRAASARPCRRCACACRQRAFCFARADRGRGCAPRACAATVHGAARACTPARSSAAGAAARRAARRVRRPPHPGEARAGASCRRSRAPRERAARAARRGSSATGRSAARCWRRSRAHGLEGVVEAPGFVATRGGRARPARARSAWCCPSRREGYGLVVVEAAARRARRASSCAAPDNAATELVEEGVNGFVADERRARGPRRRDRARARGRAASCARRTADWFARNARRLSLDALARRGRRELRRRERALVGSRASARAVALPGEPRGRARPGRAQPLGLARGRRAAARSPRRSRRDRPGRTAAPRRRRPRAATRGPSTRPARRAPSPRAPAARSPRRATGTRTRRRARTGPRRRRRSSSRGSARRPATPSAAACVAQLGLVRRRVAGQHEHRPALGRDPRERVEQAARGSCAAAWPTARARPAGRRAPSRSRSSAAGVGVAAARPAEPERHDVDLRRAATPSRATRSSRVDSRVGDDAVRAARRERHEHAHARAPRSAEVRVRARSGS